MDSINYKPLVMLFDITRLCNATVAYAFFSRMTLPKVSPTSGDSLLPSYAHPTLSDVSNQ
jgi:hypothetical protein